MKRSLRRALSMATNMEPLSSRTQLRHLTGDPVAPLASNEVVQRLTDCKNLPNGGEGFSQKKEWVASACAYFRTGCFSGSSDALVAYQEVLKGGATSLVLDLLLENEFCGYTKDYIASWINDIKGHKPNFYYIEDLLESFAYATANLLTFRWRSWNDSSADSFSVATENEHASLRPRFDQFWTTLLDLRWPLLAILGLQYQGACHAIEVLGGSIPGLMIDSKFRAVPRQHALLQVLVCIWARISPLFHELYAHCYLNNICLLLNDRPDYEHRWQEFSRDLFPSIMSQGMFMSTVRRDLKLERTSGPALDAIFSLLAFLRSENRYDPLRLTTPVDSEVFFLALAACRRQMCRGTVEKFKTLRWLAIYVRNVVAGLALSLLEKLPPSVRFVEKTIHNVVMFIASSLKYVFEHNDIEILEHFAETARKCTFMLTHDWLKELRNERVPRRMNVVRRFTLTWWEVTHADLYDMSSDKALRSVPFTRAWRRLGRVLPVEDVLGDDWKFPPLERCAWKDCLCSVHKPLHRMRICRGCHSVAYCGKRCQESDWKTGTHRERCSTLQGKTGSDRPKTDIIE